MTSCNKRKLSEFSFPRRNETSPYYPLFDRVFKEEHDAWNELDFEAFDRWRVAEDRKSRRVKVLKTEADCAFQVELTAVLKKAIEAMKEVELACA